MVIPEAMAHDSDKWAEGWAPVGTPEVMADQVDGWATRSVLESDTASRRSVAWMVIPEAMARHSDKWAEGWALVCTPEAMADQVDKWATLSAPEGDAAGGCSVAWMVIPEAMAHDSDKWLEGWAPVGTPEAMADQVDMWATLSAPESDSAGICSVARGCSVVWMVIPEAMAQDSDKWAEGWAPVSTPEAMADQVDKWATLSAPEGDAAGGYSVAWMVIPEAMAHDSEKWLEGWAPVGTPEAMADQVDMWATLPAPESDSVGICSVARGRSVEWMVIPEEMAQDSDNWAEGWAPISTPEAMADQVDMWATLSAPEGDAAGGGSVAWMVILEAMTQDPDKRLEGWAPVGTPEAMADQVDMWATLSAPESDSAGICSVAWGCSAVWMVIPEAMAHYSDKRLEGWALVGTLEAWRTGGNSGSSGHVGYSVGARKGYCGWTRRGVSCGSSGWRWL